MDKDLSPMMGSSSRRDAKRLSSSSTSLSATTSTTTSATKASSTTSSSSLDDSSNTWDCSVCTYRNSYEAFKCLMCDVRKGTSTRKPRINPEMVAQQVARQQEQIKQQAIKAVKTKDKSDRPDKADKRRDDNCPQLNSPSSSGLNTSSGDSNGFTNSSNNSFNSSNNINSEIKDIKDSLNSSTNNTNNKLSANHNTNTNNNSKGVNCKDTSCGTPTTASTPTTAANTSSPTVKVKKPRTIGAKAKLKNVDRSNAHVKEVTVNNVTVIITEFTPKKMKMSSKGDKHSNSESWDQIKSKKSDEKRRKSSDEKSKKSDKSEEKVRKSDSKKHSCDENSKKSSDDHPKSGKNSDESPHKNSGKKSDENRGKHSSDESVSPNKKLDKKSDEKASGIVLFALGIFFLVEDERSSLFKLFVVEKYNYALLQMLAWAFIVIGSAIGLIGFCGCCGAFKENRWILYSLFLLVIFALELTVGILAVIFQEKVVAELKIELTNKLQTDYGLQSSFTAAIDLAQTKFDCCGIEGPKDYEKSVWRAQRMNGQNSNVSRTCCLLQNKLEKQAHNNPRPVNETLCQSADNVENRVFRNQNGCLQKLEKFIRAESMVFVVMGCGLSGVVE
ncbi:unnamed protein product [Oppiella nova]|uniref:RanBP2-type domain-containing protein n=1 Tax=Oppiella nova TaxID=334625 RepID=A0A7R9LWC6_9ACAR|nr:unnamed protein product [Oppiella nova]CAG2167541.1 unnamed protein product [Oppiella nova]